MLFLLFFLVTFAAAVAVGTKKRLARRARELSKGRNAMLELRQGVLSRTFFTNATPLAVDTPRCVLMDWNMSGNGVATLLAFYDGTTSLYFSSGGGILGAGAHEPVKRAATRFRQHALAERSRFTPASSFELPESGTVVLYIVTDTETLSSGPIPTSELEKGTHPLTALGGSAQAVITAVRQLSSTPGRGAA
jgi:hypothetical protein